MKKYERVPYARKEKHMNNMENSDKLERIIHLELISTQINLINDIINRMLVEKDRYEVPMIADEGVSQIRQLAEVLAIKIKQEETAEEMESE